MIFGFSMISGFMVGALGCSDQIVSSADDSGDDSGIQVVGSGGCGAMLVGIGGVVGSTSQC